MAQSLDEGSSLASTVDDHPYEVGQYKVIYAFSREDTEKFRGKLKVGDASIAAKDPELYTESELREAAQKRILDYTKTAGVDTVLEYVESATRIDKSGNIVSFRDHDVHRVLLNSDFSKYTDPNPLLTGREWFNDIRVSDVAQAVAAVKANRDYIDGASAGESNGSFTLYPHQRAAVDQSLKILKGGSTDSPRRMLWNAKMRFGKTLAAYSFIEESADIKRVLVMTHRPDVNSSWFDDFKKTELSSNGWRYGSKRNGNALEDLLETDSFGQVAPISDGLVWFASLQDLRLSGFGAETMDKNSKLFSMDWDLVITDEAHEGTITDLAASVYENLNSRYFLDLSGTPYNILEAGDWDITGAERYRYDGVYHWSYTDEQKAKQEWATSNFDERNPYEVFPEIEFRTYGIDSILEGSELQGLPDYRLSEFFRADDGGNFYHEEHVLDFLQKLRGDRRYNSISPELFPYHDSHEWMFRNTLWILPSVNSVVAMKKLLARSSSGFAGFDVVNATGIGNADDSGSSALDRVREAVASPRPSITLSFRMLTTGISVPEWTAVFMMNSSSDPKSYMQTAFRAATPYVFPNGSQKSKAYIFDFNMERCLSTIVEAASGSVEDSADPVEQDRAVRERVKEFLEYAPILSMDNAHFRKPNSREILEKINEAYINEAVEQGFASRKILNRKNLSNFDIRDVDILKKLNEIQGGAKGKSADVVVSELSDETREKLKERMKELKDKDSGTPGLDSDEKLELAEAKAKLDSDRKTESKNRKNAVDILTGILCRLPMLVLAANTDRQIEPGNFNELIDDRSWQEFMPANLLRIKPEGVPSLEERKESALATEGSILYWEEIIQFFDSSIFTSACERIRLIAQEADSKDPFDRAIRMASMFSFFKNPDKETVLTPWRVVNLQYASTVGGFTSVDLERSTAKNVYLFVENLATGDLESLIVRSALQAADSGTHRLSAVWLDPGKLSPELKERAESIVAENAAGETLETALGEETGSSAVPLTRAEARAQAASERHAVDFWGQKDLTIYDINSKTALYPLYAALTKFYLKRLEFEGAPLPVHGDSYRPSTLSLGVQQELWRETVENHIYLNCRVDYSVSIAQRVLMGFDRDTTINATSIDVLELKGALEWWNRGGDVEPPKKGAQKKSYMPDWWREIDDVYGAIGATLRLASGSFIRYRRNTALGAQLRAVGHTEERFQKLLETILLSKSQGGELSMGKKADEKSAERLNAVRELLEIVDATEELPKFNLTAGNPPYQTTVGQIQSGTTQTSSVFPDFQITALKLSELTAMIYPTGRWWFNDSSDLHTLLLTETHLKSIMFFPFYGEVKVFENAAITDGLGIVFASDQKNSMFEIISPRGEIASVPSGLGIAPLDKDIAEIVAKVQLKGLPMLSERGSILKNEAGIYAKDIAHVARPWKGEEISGDEIKYYGTAQSSSGSKSEIFIIPSSLISRTIDSRLKVAFGESIIENPARSWRVMCFDRDTALGNAAVRLACFDSAEEQLNFSNYAKTSLFESLIRGSIDGRMRKLACFVPDLGDYSSKNPLFKDSPSVDELEDRLRAFFDLESDA